MRLRRWLNSGIGAGLLILGIARPLVADPPASATAAPPPRTAGPAAWPDEVIILKGADDVSEFWNKLARPDLIITRPGPAGPAVAPAVPPRARTHVVSAVKLRGRVDDDLASLVLDVDLSLLVAGPAWVPLGLDAPIISSAREGDRELELKRTDEGTWEARLEGSGSHRLQCVLEQPIRLSPERRRLELAIPEAPSTYFELDVARQVFEVDLGTGESVGKASLPGGKGTRISAHVSPRSRLIVDWADQGNTSAAATPFLAAKLEIAIEADAEWITTQSSWEIRCIRGVARSLEIRLEEPDIVQTIKLDDQFLVERIERNVLTIPLREPLRAKEVRHLTLQTRRAVPQGTPRRFESTGFSLANAVEQSGAIGITPASGVWIHPSATRGLRRIDPEELPKDLRTRPGIGLAFQFLDQPFRLGLELEESPPLYRTETSSMVTLDGDLARTETSISVQRVRGRLFDLEVDMPPGLELGTVEPRDLVENVIPLAGPASTGKESPGRSTGSRIRLHLGTAARDLREFSLRLFGQQRIRGVGDVRLGLFAPRGGLATGNRVTIAAGRDVAFEVRAAADSDGGAMSTDSDFQVQSLAERPASRSLGPAPIAVLRTRRNPTVIEGKLARHPRELSTETSADAQVSPLGIEISQESTVRVRHGTTSTLVVRVPLGRDDPWQVFQGKEGVRREELPREGDQVGRYRLILDPPLTDATTLQFRFRVPFPTRVGPGADLKTAIPWVVLEDGTAGRIDVTLAGSPDLRLTVDDPAWTREPEARERAQGPEGPGRYRLTDPARQRTLARLPIAIHALERLDLPPIVVPRALLRSNLGADQQSQTRAWYWVESHPAELLFRLPAGSRWLRARVDGRPAEQPEAGPGGVGYRVHLPADSQSKPVLVELEYQSAKAAGRPGLEAPELDGGAVILQTFWMVQIPWTQAVVGVPGSWTDENEWYWDTYAWKRRPWRSLPGLTAWVSGTADPGPADELSGEEPSDAHAYLFGHTGTPGELPLSVASRAWLITVCSGIILLAGFLIMYGRIRFRWLWIAATSLGLGLVVLAHPSVVLLITQSSLFGVILSLAGLGIQRLIERTRGPRPVGPTPVPGSPSSLSGLASPSGSPPGVGSDDSTAIRVRAPASTMDHVPASRVITAEEPEAAAGVRAGPAV